MASSPPPLPTSLGGPGAGLTPPPPPPPPGLPPPPPPGTNYLAALQPSVAFLMIGTTFSTILFCMLIAMFLFSGNRSKSQLSFLLNALSLVFGVSIGFLNGYLEIHTMLSPLDPVRADTIVAYTVIYSIGPVLVDLILLTRLFVVIPYRGTRPVVFFGLLAFPVLVKIARFINISIYLHKFAVAATGPTPAIAGPSLFATVPNVKVEWFLQLFDNLYTSGLFLWRLQSHQRLISRSGIHRSSSISARLRGLFLIALSNFVFPAIMSLIQLILYFVDTNYLHAIYVTQTNYYISTIGVVFATVWATGNHWASTNQSRLPTSALESTGFSFRGQARSTRDVLDSTIRIADTGSGTDTMGAGTDSQIDTKQIGKESGNVPLRVFVERSPPSSFSK